MPESANPGAPPATPRISVVVITRNEGSELEATVANLLRTVPPSQVELIVVDDGSTDHSTDFLDSLPGVTVLRSPGQGVARARNLGALHTSGDIILFADAHVRAPHGWHIPVAEALRDQRVGAVAPGIYSLTDPERRGFGMSLAGPDLRVPWLRKAGSAPYPVPVLPGGFLAMRRETYLRTGGYDPGMRQLGGNDAELSCRLWLSGYEQKVVPQLEVGHLFRAAAPYPAKWVALLHNRLRMALVHFHAERVERVVHALRAYEAFPAAVAMTLDTDVQERRALMARTRSFNDDWFFERFSLAC
jgi:glycosyltransferase involved in cell wall biosynthesis